MIVILTLIALYIVVGIVVEASIPRLVFMFWKPWSWQMVRQRLPRSNIILLWPKYYYIHYLRKKP